jgi:hypothetical protein
MADPDVDDHDIGSDGSARTLSDLLATTAPHTRAPGVADFRRELQLALADAR